jgi:hypothetical protein
MHRDFNRSHHQLVGTIENYLKASRFMTSKATTAWRKLTMKNIKPALTAFRLAAMANLSPIESKGELVNLTQSDYALVTTPLEGAAQTSTSKLGLSSSGLFTYKNDLSSGSGVGIGIPGINDAGSFDDNYVLTHSGGTTVSKMNLSTGFQDSSSSVSGTAIDGISSAFTYNGSTHFAAIDSNDHTVKYFQWGNSTPVASGPNVGANHSGLEVIADGAVTDLNKMPILVSRNATSGSKLDQYFNGALVESYTGGTSDPFTDISYNSDTGMLTTSGSIGGVLGSLTNYQFDQYVIPEPSTAGLMGMGALGVLALRRLKL